MAAKMLLVLVSAMWMMAPESTALTLKQDFYDDLYDIPEIAESPFIRRHHGCSTGNEPCQGGDCCGDKICVVYVPDDYRSICVSRQDLGAYNPQLRWHQNCTDSTQCIDLCCRDHRTYIGPMKYCGSYRESTARFSCLVTDESWFP